MSGMKQSYGNIHHIRLVWGRAHKDWFSLEVSSDAQILKEN